MNAQPEAILTPEPKALAPNVHQRPFSALARAPGGSGIDEAV